MAYSIYKTTEEGLKNLYEQIISSHNTYAPVKSLSKYSYKIVKSLVECEPVSPIKETNSIKPLFFPQTSEIGRYELSSDGIKELELKEDVLQREKVILGVKPCDAEAIKVLGKVASWDSYDSDFIKRRESSVIISQLCIAEDTCFCTSMDYDIMKSDASDILIIDAKGKIFLKVNTEKGKELTEKYSSLLTKAEEGETEKEIENQYEEFKKGFKINFDYNEVHEKMKDPAFLESPEYNKVTQTCLGCNACSFVCPTCHCFKVVDEKVGNITSRKKCYDSCNSCYFTLMAGGHNPRNEQYRRWRQRAMHKFVYYKERFDVNLCIGCGKCSMNCPVCIRISDVVTNVSNKTDGGTK